MTNPTKWYDLQHTLNNRAKSKAINTTDRNHIKTRAEKWRKENDYTNRGGVIVFCDDTLQGWIDTLRDARHWKPGCVAIQENGKSFIATGGNDTDGAKEWNQL